MFLFATEKLFIISKTLSNKLVSFKGGLHITFV